MKRIVIFSGTTEGRLLSEGLSKAQISHEVCVASAYGEALMQDNPYVKIHVGRMDEEEMEAFLQAPAQSGKERETVVVDATHPYATVVTNHCKEAAERLGLSYIRVLRKDCSVEDAKIQTYGSMEECLHALQETTGNILLTTGSKDLKHLSDYDEAFKNRIYVRVLPAHESLELCEEAGIAASHIIAMQGPFSVEMNAAQLKQFEIRHLVTKASGQTGGVEEKLLAAQSCQVTVHMLTRPVEENGISVEEALCLLAGERKRNKAKMYITLLGIGMGNSLNITLEGTEAIRNADAVFGAKRLIESVEHPVKYNAYLADTILSYFSTQEYTNVVILFSGDSGFYSGAKGMLQQLKLWEANGDQTAEIRILPGISSVSYLAAKIGETYEDALLYSLHGRNLPENLREYLWKLRTNEKSFVLLSGDADVRMLAQELQKEQMNVEMTVGAFLSYPEESIRTMSLAEATAFTCSGICTAFLKNKSVENRRLIPVLEDTAFIREKVPMTKALIRHESVLRLGLCEKDVVYDIGGGTGSVSIEIAGLHPSLQVYAFEKKPEAVELMRQNIEKLGALNVTVIPGEAPAALENVPAPNAVFIGGSSGELEGILLALQQKASDIRVVINAVSLETISEVNRLMKAFDVQEAKSEQVAVTEVKQLGDHHMMQANNPVMIFSFVLRSTKGSTER